jgi:aminoglycoside 3-N-acetyltransferase
VIGDEGDFDRIGAAFDATGAVTIGKAGIGEARLMRQRELVAFGVAWMIANR